MKPKEVKRDSDISKLRRDNVSTRRSGILLNGINEIVITNQKTGENPTGKVALTKREFQTFVDWWNGL